MNRQNNSVARRASRVVEGIGKFIGRYLVTALGTMILGAAIWAIFKFVDTFAADVVTALEGVAKWMRESPVGVAFIFLLITIVIVITDKIIVAYKKSKERPAQPIQPAQPAQPAQPIQPAQPVQPIQPIQPAQPQNHHRN